MHLLASIARQPIVHQRSRSFSPSRAHHAFAAHLSHTNSQCCLARPLQVRAVLASVAHASGGHLDTTALDVTAIMAGANARLLAHDDPTTIQYLVREPTPRLKGRTDPVLTSMPHGLAAGVRIRPLGWEPVLSMDGLPPLRLPTNSSVTIEVEPQKHLWLHTASFAPSSRGR